MKHAALALIVTIAWCGSAQAQAWPNAAPSPYGAATAPQPAVTAPASSNAAEPGRAGGSVGLGAPPHALGSGSPAAPVPGPKEASISPAPPVADLDNPEAVRATTALNILEAQGYAAFSDFRANGGTFTALVNDGGRQFRVVINPDTGQISRQ